MNTEVPQTVKQLLSMHTSAVHPPQGLVRNKIGYRQFFSLHKAFSFIEHRFPMMEKQYLV